MNTDWSPHRQEPVAPFKNATSREFRIPPPAGAGGFQFAGIELTYYLPMSGGYMAESDRAKMLI
jgi:hypothetical protein